jgi:hypothetical protein
MAPLLENFEVFSREFYIECENVETEDILSLENTLRPPILRY